ncbi:MAG: 3-dehydroquinate synthase [bacterium]
MYTVPIQTKSPYAVRIGRGLIDSCGEEVRRVHAPCRVAVAADSNVAPLYGARVLASLEKCGFSGFLLTFPAGEGSKNLQTLGMLLEGMAEGGLTRSDLVLALGGGVTGDMAGLAAGLYQRGLPFVQLPTSLLAAVDSSVGGKTAVDLPQGKNLVGLFHQPALVLCDTDTLSTLPPLWFRDGLGECVKYGVLRDAALLTGLTEDIPALIARCVSIKAEYVTRDEEDRGERRFLNLGHTFAHAIEVLSGYTTPHGHAVAIGMVLVARAGEKLGLTAPGTADKIAAILAAHGLPAATAFPPEALARAALGDKKREGGRITLVFPEKIGSCFLKTLPVEELERVARLGVGA